LYHAAYSALPSGPPAPAITQIDPNTAPWWELSLLPHVGDALARDIEQFRSILARPGRPAFVRAADLDDVGGIGPKTIQRLARRLRFPPTTSQPAISRP
jgi:DNA uptake protein ComE-like DNA-binding protein